MIIEKHPIPDDYNLFNLSIKLIIFPQGFERKGLKLVKGTDSNPNPHLESKAQMNRLDNSVY